MFPYLEEVSISMHVSLTFQAAEGDGRYGLESPSELPVSAEEGRESV